MLDTASPTPPIQLPTMSTTEEKPAEEPVAQVAQPAQEESLEKAQVDGSGIPGNGSVLTEPEAEYVVEVKLADMQMDPNNPLFSAKSFEQLEL